MVNYCCVQNCGRNSKLSSHLNYYSLPKERDRQKQWLLAAGREDLLEKSQYKLTYRFCSRHFAPSCIKNKHLLPDAVPSLCLPGSKKKDTDDEPVQHQDIVCNSCNNAILGFRYKCVTCIDYDLCPKCEMLETHPQHYMLRIPRPLKFKIADDMIKKWQVFFKSEHIQPDCTLSSDEDDTSDDEPITKYSKQYDSGVDLSDDVKETLRLEVARVLSLKFSDKDKKPSKLKEKSFAAKRSGSETVWPVKKQKILVPLIERTESLAPAAPAAPAAPEVAFADVNQLVDPTDVKFEVPVLSSAIDEFAQPMMHVKLSDDLTELMIEMTQNGQKTVYKYTD